MANSRKVKVCAAMFLLAVSLMASLFVVSTGMTFGLGFSVQDKHHVPLNNKNQHTHTNIILLMNMARSNFGSIFLLA